MIVVWKRSFYYYSLIKNAGDEEHKEHYGGVVLNQGSWCNKVQGSIKKILEKHL